MVTEAVVTEGTNDGCVDGGHRGRGMRVAVRMDGWVRGWLMGGPVSTGVGRDVETGSAAPTTGVEKAPTSRTDQISPEGRACLVWQRKCSPYGEQQGACPKGEFP